LGWKAQTSLPFLLAMSPSQGSAHGVDRFAVLLLARGGEVLARPAEQFLDLHIGAGALVASGRPLGGSRQRRPRQKEDNPRSEAASDTP
jgi:hypothetical protein